MARHRKYLQVYVQSKNHRNGEHEYRWLPQWRLNDFTSKKKVCGRTKKNTHSGKNIIQQQKNETEYFWLYVRIVNK